MNSGLQCLLHTIPLVSYFLSKQREKDLNINNPQGTQGVITLEFTKLVKQMISQKYGNINPDSFRKTLLKYAPQLTEGQQHDSQQFINFLLDALHEDLNKITNKPYIEGKPSDGRPDEEVSQECWERYKKRNDSKIVDLMHGQIKSSLKCQKCNRESVIFDPFAVFCVEIPEANKAYKIYLVPQTFEYSIQMISYQKQEEQQDLNQRIRQQKIILIEHDNENFKTQLASNIQSIQKEVAYAYEIYPKKEDEYRTFIQFQIEKKKLGSNQYEKIGIPEIYDICQQINIFNLYKNIYFLYFYDSFKVTNMQKEKPFEIRIVSDLNEQKILQSLNKDIRTPLEDNSNQQSCVFCRQTNQCKDGHFISYNQTEIIENFLQLSHFSIRVNFKYNVKQFTKTIEKRNFVFQNINQVTTSKITLYDCFNHLQQTEQLTGENQFYCSCCKEHVNGIERIQMYNIPEIFMIQLKRFKQIGTQFKKIEKEVEYPEELDIGQYLPETYQESTIYDLYAVNIHLGSEKEGHYKAYVKVDEQ